MNAPVKVGDYVRAVQVSGPQDAKNCIGSVGRVVDIPSEYSFQVFFSTGNTWYCNEVEPATKEEFRAGEDETDETPPINFHKGSAGPDSEVGCTANMDELRGLAARMNADPNVKAINPPSSSLTDMGRWNFTGSTKQDAIMGILEADLLVAQATVTALESVIAKRRAAMEAGR